MQIDRSVSPEQIRWYLDGNNYFTVNANRVDATTWANAVDHPFFIIYDLAMGGGFPDAFGGGPNAATVSGGQMNIDYVAVYNKAPGGGGGAGGSNIAQGKPTTASSDENATFPAANATDGNTGTRWSSAFSDPQWLQVDLGQTYNINHVTLNWEAAYGRAYQIQTSTDGTTWTTDLLDDHRRRRHRRPRGHRHRPLHPDERHGRAPPRTATRCGSSRVNGTPSGGGRRAPCCPRATRPPRRRPRTPALGPANAVDGNTGTRWSSAFSDPQWIQVDLGATHAISRVVLNWEAAYGAGVPDPDLAPTAPRGRRSTRPPPAPAACRT